MLTVYRCKRCVNAGLTHTGLTTIVQTCMCKRSITRSRLFIVCLFHL